MEFHWASRQLCEIGLPGFYHRVDIDSVRQGQTFSCHNINGNEYERKIVEWVPLRAVSIGQLDEPGWEHEFVLTPSGDKTRLTYSRKFKGSPLGLLGNKIGGCNYQKIVDEVADKAKMFIPRAS